VAGGPDEAGLVVVSLVRVIKVETIGVRHDRLRA